MADAGTTSWTMIVAHIAATIATAWLLGRGEAWLWRTAEQAIRAALGSLTGRLADDRPRLIISWRMVAVDCAGVRARGATRSTGRSLTRAEVAGASSSLFTLYPPGEPSAVGIAADEPCLAYTISRRNFHDYDVADPPSGWLKRSALAAALGAAGLALLPATAGAHVTVHTDSTASGSFSALTFRVPNESDSASTVKLEVQLPKDTPFLYVSSKPIPGLDGQDDRGSAT